MTNQDSLIKDIAEYYSLKKELHFTEVEYETLASEMTRILRKIEGLNEKIGKLANGILVNFVEQEG